MMRFVAVIRALAGVGMMVLLVGCASDSNTGLSAHQRQPAVPGSKKDFAVNVGDRVFFTVNLSNLSERNKEILRRQAAWLKLYKSVRIRIEGHADERGTREYNLGLSARRASNTKAYLVSQGVNSTRLSTISYGKERPVALCDAESCWSQNRRSVAVVVAGAVSG